MRILQMLKYLSLDGRFLPFKIHCPAGIRIRSGVRLRLAGRLTIGNPDKKAAVVSRLPANIYFGEGATIDLGHSISIGPGVNLIVKDKGRLSIGNNTYFTSDAHIEVKNELVIGENCAVSWGVTIIDDDHHHLLGASGASEIKNSVQIGNKVWIGCNVTILKGTVIGNNCIIGAHSLVKGIVPDNCMIAGNPARILKEHVDWK